jgi:gluconokinase
VTGSTGPPVTIVIVMGVSGSGKTTVGKLLAERAGWPFFDGDDFHPESNVEKMRRGLALTDEDRWPWLDALRDLIDDLADRRESAVLACSALRASYRDRLLAGSRAVRIVYLEGTYDVIEARLRARADHFFDPGLLASQFEALEEPTDVIAVDVARPPEAIVAEIVRRLELEEETEEQDGAEPHQAD